MKAKSLFGKQTCTGDPPGVRLGFVFALPGRSILLQGLEQPRFASIPNWLCLAPFAVPGPPQRELPDTLVLSARVSCLLRSRHPSSPVLVIRPGLCHPPFGLRHPPSPIRHSAIPTETSLLRRDNLQHVICVLVTATSRVIPLYTICAIRAVNPMELRVYIAKGLPLTATQFP
jgi:hypothetical protein